MAKKPAGLKNRILELKKVPTKLVTGAPWNWRTHPDNQKAAVRASLDELGQIAPLLARKLPNGKFQVFDGHLRLDLVRDDIGPETLVAIVVTDLTEAEARKANLILDPLSAMAETNREALAKLLGRVKSSEESLQLLFKELETSNKATLELITAGLPDAGIVPEGEAIPTEAGAQIRMAQLFLTVDTYPRFNEWVSALKAKYKTNSITDTVMECLRRANDPTQKATGTGRRK